jgi:hypothetical protein
MLNRSSWWSTLLLMAHAVSCSHKQPAAYSPPPPLPPTANSTASPGAQPAAEDPMCPMAHVQGLHVMTEDTSDGVAVVFKTEGDVADLRARVRRIADMHNRQMGPGAGSPDMHGGAGSTPEPHAGSANPSRQENPPTPPSPEDLPSGQAGPSASGGGPPTSSEAEPGNAQPMHGRGMGMVPSRASVEDIPGGARLILTPNDPSKLSALREQARMHAQMIARGECPMMEPPASAS